jgi:hypothetical protein
MTSALTDLAGFTWKDEPSFRAWLLTVARREALMAAFPPPPGARPGREDDPEAALVAPPADHAEPGCGARRGRPAPGGCGQCLAPDDQRVVRLPPFRACRSPRRRASPVSPTPPTPRHVFRRALKRLSLAMMADTRTWSKSPVANLWRCHAVGALRGCAAPRLGRSSIATDALAG